jgi:hypothetical protein
MKSCPAWFSRTCPIPPSFQTIRNAPVVSFSLLPESTDALLRAGVSEDVIKAMAARVYRPVAQPEPEPAAVMPAKETTKDKPERETPADNGMRPGDALNRYLAVYGETARNSIESAELTIAPFHAADRLDITNSEADCKPASRIAAWPNRT